MYGAMPTARRGHVLSVRAAQSSGHGARTNLHFLSTQLRTICAICGRKYSIGNLQQTPTRHRM